MNPRVMTRLSLFSAMAGLLMIVFSIPLMPAAPFLKYEPSDVMTILAAVSLGPWYGVLSVALKNVLFFLFKGATPAGLFMNFVATGTLTFLAGYFYHLRPGVKSLMLGGAVGTLALATVTVPLNLIVVPLFHGVPFETVLSMLVPVYIPFNLLKGALSTALTIPLYLAVAPVLRPAASTRGAG